MSSQPSSRENAPAEHARPTRRALLRLGLAAAAGLILAGTGQATDTQRIHRSTRPPLPGMGPSFREEIAYAGGQPAGTIVIDAGARMLVWVLPRGRAYRYRISVGREGFGWSGRVRVGARKEWPAWRPPAEMRARVAGLPEMVPPGPYNPLGARALYLYRGGKDTLYRIHGTNDPAGVGFDGTSGCFRMTNTDVIDLYGRVAVGTPVLVL
ncbi:L,D-transpeptidase [Devosia sp.]|uniref:L,D-transpeptidase n=1 Tax=Devosia sp. TaxID=1871048 RepID=UPI002EEB381C